VIKSPTPKHYPDMQASVASLEVHVMPPAVTTAEDSKARTARLVRREFSFIWRLLRRLGLSEHDADDGAQQVFLVAAKRIDSIKLGSERSFLFGTALRVASRLRKNHGKQPSVDVATLDAHHDPGPGPDEIADRRRAREVLDSILEEMHDDVRIVFVLYEIEELTMAEIATTLSVPPGTIASRLRRAREIFAEKVAALQPNPQQSNPQRPTGGAHD
jgi:RNA polymerase sigma-70 factor (ECF subfamily)